MTEIANVFVTPIDNLFDALLMGGVIGICVYFALMIYDVEYKCKDKREAKRENLQIALLIGVFAMVGILMMLL